MHVVKKQTGQRPLHRGFNLAVEAVKRLGNKFAKPHVVKAFGKTAGLLMLTGSLLMANAYAKNTKEVPDTFIRAFRIVEKAEVPSVPNPTDPKVFELLFEGSVIAVGTLLLYKQR
jgi:hypothetical protein